MPLTVEIASPPDRERIVAEIWLDDEMIAEVNAETEKLVVELYPRPDGTAWIVDFDDLERALGAARSRLAGMA